MDTDTTDLGALDGLGLLPPSEDGVFKSLLTRAEAKPVLRDVLGSFLELPVIDAEVRNVETPIFDIGEKRQRFDINCKLDGNRQAEVEMQTVAMDGDSTVSGHRNIKGRAIMNLCDIHAKQGGRGDAYGSLMQSFQITICGYTVFPDREGFIDRFSFRDKRGYELSDAVGIVFAELSKLSAVMKKPVGDMTPAEMWAIFFRYADAPKHRQLLAKITKTRSEIKMATELLTTISKDETERANYHTRLVLQRDNAHTRAVLRREGHDAGLKEGRVAGLKEGHDAGLNEGLKAGHDAGLKEGRMEIAKNLLSFNTPIETIAQATGLSLSELERLRGGKQ
ncbi:MAG: Rpn family recombination-promoting nuclease/putative transposase [Oscillospiraceae bacterium]|jgi:predicted transposase/invertase (TIGR01784 family)|nr:Rpn family recombination-promoting nuclease/putative transposase [Oscillospiraceae bacterium]